MKRHNKALDRSWLAFRFSKLVYFVQFFWFSTLTGVGPPAR